MRDATFIVVVVAVMLVSRLPASQLLSKKVDARLASPLCVHSSEKGNQPGTREYFEWQPVVLLAGGCTPLVTLLPPRYPCSCPDPTTLHFASPLHTLNFNRSSITSLC